MGNCSRCRSSECGDEGAASAFCAAPASLLSSSALANSLPAGATVSGVHLTRVARYAGEPKSVLSNIRLSATVHQSGQTLTIYSDNVAVVGNLIESTITLTSAGAPMAAALEQRIITTVGNRVAAA